MNVHFFLHGCIWYTYNAHMYVLCIGSVDVYYFLYIYYVYNNVYVGWRGEKGGGVWLIVRIAFYIYNTSITIFNLKQKRQKEKLFVL